MIKQNKPSILHARKRIKQAKVIKNIFSLKKEYKNLGKNKTYFVRTYGCQGNVRDGEIISGILESLGYKKAIDEYHTDLLILNTCAIRENAELKVFGEIGQLKKLKQKNKSFCFGICGCMAQEENVIERIIKKIKYLDFVFGIHNIYELPDILYEKINNKTTIIRVYSKEGNIYENLPTIRNSSIKAFVNVVDGCDNFCSYCIVPYTRGKLRSRNKDDILFEINNLLKNGYKEVTLLGQNVNSYGIDKNDGYKFINLLEDVCKTKIKRVRFVTSNPWNFDLSIIKLFKKYNNLMPYFHLPIQSGDEHILQMMNRKMKIKKYLELINLIKKNVEEYAISTDIIVGFPNESDKEFNNTIKLYKNIKYDNAYTFIYSKKDGTPAAIMDDSISASTKKNRLYELNKLVVKYSRINNEKYIGKTVEVLVEGVSKTNNEKLTGYSRNWKVVNFSGNAKIGDIVYVKIKSVTNFSLDGILVKK